MDVGKGHDVKRINLDILNSIECKTMIKNILDQTTAETVSKIISKRGGNTPWCDCWESFKQWALKYLLNQGQLHAENRRAAERKCLSALDPESGLSTLERAVAKEEYDILLDNDVKKMLRLCRSYSLSLDEKMSKEFFVRQKNRNNASTFINRLIVDENQKENENPAIYDWKQNSKEIKQELSKFWNDILSYRQTENKEDSQTEVCDLIKAYAQKYNMGFSDPDLALLDSDITHMDLVDAIHAIKLGKSPGVDGLPVEFYAAL